MSRHLTMCLMVAALMATWSSGVAAQTERTARNTVYIELGGNALLYSVSYERILPSDIALRAGAGYMSLSSTAGTASSSVSSLGIPITASYLGFGKLELGGGVLLQRFSGATSTGFGDDIEAGVFVPMATFIAGLRLAPPGGGFNFKLGFTPMWHPDVGFFPWASLAFGVGFQVARSLDLETEPPNVMALGGFAVADSTPVVALRIGHPKGLPWQEVRWEGAAGVGGAVWKPVRVRYAKRD